MQSYFSHDSNARNSDKLLPVRMKYGAEGYGIYFMIIERLREEKNYMSVKDYNMLAFDLRVDTSKIKDLVENFGLFAFTENGECFYSEGFNKRMELKDEKTKKRSEAGKKGAKKRWANSSDSKANGNAMAMPSDSDSKKRKVKESKENKNKTYIPTPSSGSTDVPAPVNDSLDDIIVPFAEILAYLNEKTGKRFSNIAGNQRYIQARWNEGKRLEDFKQVIDNMTINWQGKTFQGEPAEKFLQPSTLFGDKFDQYLNMVPAEPEETFTRPDDYYDVDF